MLTAAKVSIDDFLKLPDRPDLYLELHDGEVVEVPGPNLRHKRLQTRIQSLLNTLLSGNGFEVFNEFLYVLSPFEVRRADVAVVRRDRLDQQISAAAFTGSPELVVEVLSPSNTALDLLHLRRKCLSANTEQFWVIDPIEQVVEVYRQNAPPSEHSAERQPSINFQLAGSQYQLSVREIFLSEG
ncbi:MAG: Uma2 family endonuclease [Bryobacteraceae bacterium]|nr:Uma2 family endonuclease [Bryobacteraceae bacterium]